MLSPGVRLGPYEITAKLGEGGMGEVWRARDTRLGREVALKVLPEGFVDDPERHARFEREAKMLASLNHPNVAVLYGLEHLDGRHALVMELVEGEDLAERLRRGAMPADEALPIALQIAEGLEAAHEKGIVHRDLKPANVKVRPDGTVKILDFGLAKSSEDRPETSDPGHSPTVMGVYTRVGVILGTLAYMSPEQARGQVVDRRTDIWAFGCVLYELLTGRAAFPGESIPDVMAAIVTTDPDWEALPAELPEGVRATLRRCVEKEPNRRLRDLGEVRAGLAAGGADKTVLPVVSTGRGAPRGPSLLRATGTRIHGRRRRAGALAILGVVVVAGVTVGLRAARWPAALFGSPGARSIRSLAVLPLENLSGDPGQEYFADGMTEALINTLAQIGALSVMSRTTVMQFKSTHLPLPQIARRLNGVDALIEGSVQRSGERVKIAVQLIRAATGTSVWAKAYERSMSDVLALQGEVAQAIADEIRIELTPGERTRLASITSVNPDAYDLFLRGRARSRHENREDNDAAISLLERAVAADPNLAAAHAELARAYGIRLDFFVPDDQDLAGKEEHEVDAALRLDPDSSDAHLARGLLLWTPRHRFASVEAIRELRRALELNPSSDEAHHQLGLVYLHIGLLDQALREGQEAVRLNPANTLALYRQGVVRLYRQDYRGALEVFSKIPPDFNPVVVNYQTTWTLFRLGRKREARERTEAYAKRYPTDVGGLNASMEAILAADAGDAGRALERIRAAVERGRGYLHFHHTAYNVAVAYAMLHRPKEALQWLQVAADTGLPCYPLFAGDADLDNIRQQPGFVAFLAQQKQQWEAFNRL